MIKLNQILTYSAILLVLLVMYLSARDGFSLPLPQILAIATQITYN
ncbi:hypothetical protein [Nostoc sp. FACHB-110]|nr:hypothetical protein [Nostoc sp. FACHB-110]MBD2441542.1 hypothetical protein [Nostoc sp. FACHB-110]